MSAPTAAKSHWQAETAIKNSSYLCAKKVSLYARLILHVKPAVVVMV
jgi:hypothetical protein